VSSTALRSAAAAGSPPWGWIVRGLASIGLGAAALLWPERSLEALVTLLGAAALIGGAAALTTSRLRVVGTLDLVLAVAVFIYPGASAGALLWPIAFSVWAILTGAAQIPGSGRMLKLSGAISIVAGLLTAAANLGGTEQILWAVGAYALLAGAALLAAAFDTRSA
jgi:uncharacterized membrane protein HdeD (DUF308 family)